MRITVQVSPGEAVDKLTILMIKGERISAPEKLANIVRESEVLRAVVQPLTKEDPEVARLMAELKAVNERLWEIEDDIRAQESAQDFGPRFVELARSVYLTNDKRAALKKEIDTRLGSDISEEKSYQPYQVA